MSRTAGKMNSGRIKASPTRLMPIAVLLMRAPHPLSAEEIAQQGYDMNRSGKIMLNVSTNIGEMRSDENRQDGYIVSEAHRWIVIDPGQEYEDKACRFLIRRAQSLPWHDGRPRYWMIAAPGWNPQWRITDEGILLPMYGHAMDQPPSGQVVQADVDDARLCAHCGGEIPVERLREMAMTCCDEHGRLWRESLRPKVEEGMLL